MLYKGLKIKLLETSSKSKKCKSDYTTMIIFFFLLIHGSLS